MAWLGWLVVLTVLSSMSQPGPKIEMIGSDKVLHAVYFALGGICLTLSLALHWPSGDTDPRFPGWRRLAVGVILAGAAVGWGDEWHQSFTPGRHGLDLFDWVADVSGSALALPVARSLFRRLARPGPAF